MRALDTLDVRGGRVGVDEAALPAPSWTILAERLSPRAVVPASEHLLTARRVKSPYELECLERALHIAEEALNQVIQVIKPGLTEREAIRIYETEVLKRGAETYPAIVAFGERTAIPAPWPTDRALRAGGTARFDLGCVFKGYYASVARTAVMGTPDERQQRASEAVEAGLEAALDAIRPGIPAARVHQAAVEAAAQEPAGLSRRPDRPGHRARAGRAPELGGGVITPLEAGEVLLRGSALLGARLGRGASAGDGSGHDTGLPRDEPVGAGVDRPRLDGGPRDGPPNPPALGAPRRSRDALDTAGPPASARPAAPASRARASISRRMVNGSGRSSVSRLERDRIGGRGMPVDWRRGAD